MKEAVVFCVLLSQSLGAMSCTGVSSKENTQPTASPTAGRIDVSRVWHPATYRGLKIGRSKVAEMRRVLGRPTLSEVFDENKSNPEVWYHYEGIAEFPGRVTVVVDKNTGTIQAVDIHPKTLRKEDAIKHFGPDYVITRYDFDSCLGDEESAPLFESPAGAVISIEYRKRGIAVAVDEGGRVNTISYVSEPIGAASSKCK